MALTNVEKQRRHRKYKAMAIKWFEAATGFTMKEVIQIMKFADDNEIVGVELYKDE